MTFEPIRTNDRPYAIFTEVPVRVEGTNEVYRPLRDEELRRANPVAKVESETTGLTINEIV